MSPCNLRREHNSESAFGRQQSEQRLQRIAELAPRYLAVLLRRRQEDPIKEAIVEQARSRLQSIHEVGQQYLPAASEDGLWTMDFSGLQKERVSERRPKDGSR